MLLVSVQIAVSITIGLDTVTGSMEIRLKHIHH